MTFEVETGTGSATANSYTSIAYADAYHTTYGNTDWATDGSVPDETKQLALVNATLACDLLFGARYMSMPSTMLQALLFPRFSFIKNQIQLVNGNVIPFELQMAVSELALAYLDGTNVYPTPNLQGQYLSESSAVGTLKTSVTYSEMPKVESYSGFWKVEMLLRPIIWGEDMDGNPGMLSL